MNVFGAHGNLAQSAELIDGNNTVDLSHLHGGFYSVEVICIDFRSVTKIIKR